MFCSGTTDYAFSIIYFTAWSKSDSICCVLSNSFSSLYKRRCGSFKKVRIAPPVFNQVNCCLRYSCRQAFLLCTFPHDNKEKSLETKVSRLFWSCYPDLNRRPHPYQGCALPTELQQQIWRPGTGSNRRPPAWQAGVLTNWTTGPFATNGL